MKYERIRNTRRNALWGLMEKLCAILLPFLTRTALIRLLGLGYAGIGGLLTAVLQVLSLAELGLSSAIQFSLYRPLADNDTDKVCALLAFYRKTYRRIGFCVLLLGGALFPLLPRLIAADLPRDVRLWAVYAAYLTHAVTGYFLYPSQKALLLASQRNDTVSRSALLMRAITSLCQISALLLARDYHLFIVFLPLSALGEQLLCARQAKKLFPQYACRGELGQADRTGILEKTKGLLVHRLCGQTRNAFDQLFLSAFFGLTVVGIYGNYFYILQSVRSLLDVITFSMSAGVGNSVALDSPEKNYHDLCVFTFLYECLCGVCTVCLLCLYQPFMTLWCGEKALFSTDVVIAFCVYFYVWTMGDIKSQYADARGLWWKNRWRTVCEALCNLVLNALLLRWLGVFGIVIATGISILLVGFPWSVRILFRDYFPGRSPFRYMADHLLYAAVTALSCCAAWLLCAQISLPGVPGLLLRVPVCLLCPGVLYFLCYRRTVRFREGMAFLRRALSPRV